MKTAPGCPKGDSNREKKKRQAARHMEKDCGGGGEVVERKDLE